MAEENTSMAGGIGLPVGSFIGKYEIKERKAIGGQSVVYKGYDRMLARFVAIKQIASQLAEDPKFLERFRREAQILARLGTHQSAIVTIHELIEDHAGLFIVMEYVEGPTVETILNDTNGPTEPKAALQVIFRLAAALHDVHQAGVIHRDIKPSNIIICEGLRPKITDFGVAASVSGQTSMVLGTTKYMAPELFTGEDVDGRVDIYALGMVAYELLAGRPKFKEIFADIVRDPHSESLRWMKWHGNEAVAAPPLSEVNPAIPKVLSDIVAKMMAKKRSDRYVTMEALGRAIKQTFSPRRAAAAQAAQAGSGDGALPTDPAARKAALMRLKAMAQDEGDELEVQPQARQEPNPTAPIPRKAMSLRTKLILGGVAAAVVLVAVGGYVAKLMSEHSQQAEWAKRAYESAMKTYEGRDYKRAAEGFAALALDPNFAGSAQRSMAAVMAHVAKARQVAQTAEEASQWDQVIAEEAAARDEIKLVQAANKNLLQWTRDVSREVDNFSDDRSKVRQFRSIMHAARTAMAGGKYADSLSALDSMGTSISGLTDEQKTQRDALRQQVLHAQLSQRFTDEVARGDGLDDFKAAKEAYEAARELVNSAPGGVFTVAEGQALGAQVDAKLQARGTKERFRAAMSEAEAAHASGNKNEEVLALGRADEIQTSDELKARITRVKSDMQVDKAEAAIGAKDFVTAKAALEEAMKIDPSNTAAAGKLAELEKGTQKTTLVGEADTLVAQAKYPQALEKYLAAAQLGPDDELNKKILDVKFRMQLAVGDDLRQKKDYVGALAAYEIARAIDPTKASVVDDREAMTKKLREYDDQIRRGDAFMKTHEWSRAREAYAAAKAILDTAEVKQKIALSLYTENLTRGKEAMDDGNWNSAAASFQIAKKYQEDAQVTGKEVDELLAKAQAKDAANKP